MHLPPPPPTCWEFFGFSGPTNRQNLCHMYRERVNTITPAGAWNAMQSAYVYEQYQRCLKEIDGPNPPHR